MTINSKPNCDFLVERNRDDAFMYTPYSYEADDWARRNLSKCVRWGRSYLLPETRGNSLRGYLSHKEGFTVKVDA